MSQFQKLLYFQHIFDLHSQSLLKKRLVALGSVLYSQDVHENWKHASILYKKSNI
jgi:hypothetical protein